MSRVRVRVRLSGSSTGPTSKPVPCRVRIVPPSVMPPGGPPLTEMTSICRIRVGVRVRVWVRVSQPLTLTLTLTLT